LGLGGVAGSIFFGQEGAVRTQEERLQWQRRWWQAGLGFAVALALVAAPGRAQLASLAADLAPGLAFEPNTLGPSDFVPLGESVVFTAASSDANQRFALHSTQGVAGDLVTLVDGLPAIERLLAGPDRAFYRVRSRRLETRLLVTDGRPEGTAEIGPAFFGLRSIALLPETGLAFFRANLADPDAEELWVSDGTSGGTRRLVDAARLGGRLVDAAAIDLGSRIGIALSLLPTGSDSVRSELWISDGTPSGTQRVTTLAEPWRRAARFGSGFLFWLLPSEAPAELWRSDGTAAGTARIAAFAGRPQELSYEIAVIGDQAFFLADNGTHGIELWAYRPGPSPLRRLTGFPRKVPFDPTLGFRQKLLALGDRVLFAAEDGISGTELWESRGTPATTRRVADLCPGACSGVGSIELLEPVGGAAVFAGRTPASGFEAWSYQPGAAPELLADFCPGPCGGLRSRLGLAGGELVLHVSPNGGPDVRLAVTDGTPTGTDFLAIPSVEVEGFSTLLPDVAVAKLGRRFVVPVGRAFTSTLWSVGRPAQGASLVYRRLRSAAASGSPERLVELAGNLLFTSCVGTERHLLRLVGQGPGVVDLASLGSSCPPSQRPMPFAGASVGGRVVFLQDGTGTLWSSDGTPAGTLRLIDGASATWALTDPVAYQGRAWFFTSSASGFVQLVSTDGTAEGTRTEQELAGHDAAAGIGLLGDEMVLLTRNGENGWGLMATSGDPADVRVLGELDLGGQELEAAVFFATPTHAFVQVRYVDTGSGVGQGGLWATDGTAAGTVRLPGHLEFSTSFRGESIALAFGGALLYTAVGEVPPRYSLFRSDGTVAGTEVLAELAGMGGIGKLVEWRGAAWFLTERFSASLGALWRSDGSAAATGVVASGIPGLDANDLGLFATDAGLLFAADRVEGSAFGNELWASDGTSAGTRLLHEIQPGGGSRPRGFVRAGERVYFSAFESLTGRELWSLPADLAPRPCEPSPTALCLGDGRFRVELAHFDAAGNVSKAKAVPLTADTGSFWFFSPDNLEALVKVLDGTGLNDRFWVFQGSLSNVQQVLTVTDSVTGAARRYGNAQGQFRSFADVEAFAPDRVLLAAPFDPPPSPATTELLEAKLLPLAAAACAADPAALPLLGGRFAATVALEDPTVPSLTGQPIPWSPDAGFFWFFGPSNLEVAVKVVDGALVNGKAWVFSASLSNLGYRLTVTDCTTGTLRTYRNAPGRFASFADTAAF
jgi:ELWxxDGT repeat protein